MHLELPVHEWLLSPSVGEATRPARQLYGLCEFILESTRQMREEMSSEPVDPDDAAREVADFYEDESLPGEELSPSPDPELDALAEQQARDRWGDG